MLVLDLPSTDTPHRKIYTPQMKRRVGEFFPTSLTAERHPRLKHLAETSAFGGQPPLLEEPFPKVKLPVLGADFPLVSMHDDAKCNRRYEFKKHTVVPVTPAQALWMAGALTHILDRKLEGFTWRGVANGRFEAPKGAGGKRGKREAKDLLIAFLEEEPELGKIASYFGAGNAVTQSKFEADAKTVCDALDGVARERPTSRIQLFVLRKASKGQAYVALAESPTVVEVLEAARRWSAAVKEILPPIKLSGLGAEAPYPDQVVRLLSYQWVRDGSSPVINGKRQKPYHEVAGPSLGEVLAVMLRTEGKSEPAARRILDLVLARTGPLLLGLFAAKHAFGPRRLRGKRELLYDYPRQETTGRRDLPSRP